MAPSWSMVALVFGALARGFDASKSACLTFHSGGAAPDALALLQGRATALYGGESVEDDEEAAEEEAEEQEEDENQALEEEESTEEDAREAADAEGEEDESLAEADAEEVAAVEEFETAERDSSQEEEFSNDGVQSIAYFDKKRKAAPVKFFLYAPEKFEPRFEGSLANCDRKGADYMFLESLINHKDRVYDYQKATVKIVPCLFESYRRCTSTNHAEKPPPALLTLNTNGKPVRNGSRAQVSLVKRRNLRIKKEDPHPEDFEDIPWVKPLDYETQQCIEKVQAHPAYQATEGVDHAWVVADWAVNFGRTAESELFKSMSIGRIEIVDQETADTSNRPKAVEQSRCSFVVPYASDLAYVEDWNSEPSFDEWMERENTVSFRFEDRRYVLFCKADPCPGAFDATPLRRKSLKLKELFDGAAQIEMSRVPMDEFITEQHGSKFCLVIRGDTPSSHGFYDALAANCVPIVVSDKWEAVAGPYAFGGHGELAGGVSSSAYTLQFSEHRWMNDIEGVAAEIQDVLADRTKARALFDAMQQIRPALLWSHPDSWAADLALQSAKSCTES